MKKFFAPLLKNSLTTLLAGSILLAAVVYGVSQTTLRSTKALPVATFAQDIGNSRQVIIVRAKNYNVNEASLEAQEIGRAHV